MKNILIIGGNGFIGSNLCDKLIEENYVVKSFDIVLPVKKNQNVDYVIGNFFDENDLISALQNVDVVIHALSTVNPGNSNERYLQGYTRDFIQTVRLCELVIERNIKLLFISSGGAVYGNQELFPISETAKTLPINHYGNIKVCIENLIHTFNIQKSSNMMIARISNVYGPGQDSAKGVGFIDAVLKASIKKEKLHIWGDGEVIRDYIYIEDVCNMLINLIEYNGNYEVFNLSSNVGRSQKEIIKEIMDMGLHVEAVYGAARSVDVHKIVLDNSRMMSLYKRDMYTLAEGIKKSYQWLLNPEGEI